MSLWAEYGPRSGGILVLVASLIAMFYCGRRRKIRLANGWQLLEKDQKYVKNLDDLGRALLLFVAAAYISDLKIVTGVLLLLYMMVSIIPREQWVAPEHESRIPH